MPKKVDNKKRAKSAPKSVSKKAAPIKKAAKATPKKAKSAKTSPAKKSPVADKKKDGPQWKAPFHKSIRQWHDVDQYFQMNEKY